MVSPPPVAPRRLRADAARNRQRLIDAAERLFAARGLRVTLDDVAREAGVNVATAYRHFANKHELATAFIEQTIDRIARVAEQAAEADDPWMGLAQFLEQCLDLMASNRGLGDLLTRTYGAGWFEQLRERVDPPVARLLIRAQQAGLVRPELTLHDFGVILPMLGSVLDLATGPALARRYLSLVLAGLRPSDVRLAGSPPTDAELRSAVVTEPKLRNRHRHRIGTPHDAPGDG